TLTMALVGTSVLLDHNSALVSPLDYAVLGFRPISSRTYFAVRATNVLVYTTTLTTFVTWLPTAALFVRYGLAIGTAAIVAFYACAIVTTLTMLTIYAWMMSVITPDAIQRALSYVQLVLGVLVYTAPLLITPALAKSVVVQLGLRKTPWLMLYPATWF